MSDDESIVEEEYLIYADLRDNVDPNIFKHAETSFKSFALDSDQPILIIGGQAFVGTYKDTVGTAVFLEEAPSDSEDIDIGREPSDPLFVKSPSNLLRYVAHTRKTLEMSRVLLIEKNNQVDDKHQEEEDGMKELSSFGVFKQEDTECIETSKKDGNSNLSHSATDIHKMEYEISSDNLKGEAHVKAAEDNSSMISNERVVEDIEHMNINDSSVSSNT